MDKKIQIGLDMIKEMFTKKIGEVGVFLGAEIILSIITMIPMALIFGYSILSAGASSGMGSMSFGDMKDLVSGIGSGQVNFGIMFELLKPLLLAGFLTLVISTFVVNPIIAILRTSLLTIPAGNFSENLNSMVKAVMSKFTRVLLLFVFIGLIYLALTIGVVIVAVVLGLIFGLLGSFGAVLLALILIAILIAAFWLLLPVTIFAPFDAILTEKPIQACIMDAFNAKKYRLPILIIGIVTGAAGWVLSSIFVFIPIPFLLGIIVSAVTIAQYCVLFPYYQEYSGTLTA